MLGINIIVVSFSIEFYLMLREMPEGMQYQGENVSLSPPFPLKEEFTLNQKLRDSLDYREEVDKSDTNDI